MLEGHTNPVLRCAWSSNEKQIISASADGTIRTWDPAAGQEIAPTLYHFSHGWASLDHQNNRILACSPEAWRYVGWIVPDAVTGMPEWLPAETFRALPVVALWWESRVMTTRRHRQGAFCARRGSP
jgi:hypothetical protein